MPNPTPPAAFPVEEAIRFSGLTRTHLYEALRRGEIEARKAGRRTLIIGDSLRAYVASLPAARYSPPPAPAKKQQSAA